MKTYRLTVKVNYILNAKKNRKFIIDIIINKILKIGPKSPKKYVKNQKSTCLLIYRYNNLLEQQDI